jgi:putative PIN family toxin of toxin-antitoxin system
VRFVLDTNVLFAAFLTHGVCAGLYEEYLLQADLIVSDFILKELADRLTHKGRLTHTEAQVVVQAIRKDAHSVAPPPLLKPICRDMDDDWVLATAVAGHADAIVTGDQDLLILKTHAGIPIVTPRDALALLHVKR